MKTKEPIVAKYNNNLIPYLKSYIVDKLEEENNLDVLEKIYSIISPESKMSFEQKFALAKEQTEKYCPEELAKELEAEGFIYSIPGKGSFVSPSREISGEELRRRWEDLDRAVRELRFLGVSEEELIRHLKDEGGDAK